MTNNRRINTAEAFERYAEKLKKQQQGSKMTSACGRTGDWHRRLQHVEGLGTGTDDFSMRKDWILAQTRLEFLTGGYIRFGASGVTGLGPQE